MFEKVVLLKKGQRVANTMGLQLQEGFEEAAEIIYNAYRSARDEMKSLHSMKVNDVFAEQVLEEKRLAKRLHSRAVRLAASPVTYMITQWDDERSMGVTLRNTRGAEKRYSVTYNAGDRDVLRQQFIEKMEALVVQANATPYEFWK